MAYYSNGKILFRSIIKKVKMCKCGSNPEEEDHICPYAEDIHGDRESLCNCCSVCASNCAADI